MRVNNEELNIIKEINFYVDDIDGRGMEKLEIVRNKTWRSVGFEFWLFITKDKATKKQKTGCKPS